MPRAIWKFKLDVDDTQIISMPKGARVLSVQVQAGDPCIWVEVDPTAAMERRKFQTYGTGHQLRHTSSTFLGTYQLRNGALVFHVYEDEDYF